MRMHRDVRWNQKVESVIYSLLLMMQTAGLKSSSSLVSSRASCRQCHYTPRIALNACTTARDVQKLMPSLNCCYLEGFLVSLFSTYQVSPSLLCGPQRSYPKRRVIARLDPTSPCRHGNPL